MKRATIWCVVGALFCFAFATPFLHYSSPSVATASSMEGLLRRCGNSVVSGVGRPQVLSHDGGVHVYGSGYLTILLILTVVAMVLFCIIFVLLQRIAESPSTYAWVLLVFVCSGVLVMFLFMGGLTTYVVARPSCDVRREDESLHLSLHSWGRLRDEIRIGGDQAPRVVIYPTYGRVARYYVFLVWEEGQSLKGVNLACINEDKAIAEGKGRHVARLLGVPLKEHEVYQGSTSGSSGDIADHSQGRVARSLQPSCVRRRTPAHRTSRRSGSLCWG